MKVIKLFNFRHMDCAESYDGNVFFCLWMTKGFCVCLKLDECPAPSENHDTWQSIEGTSIDNRMKDTALGCSLVYKLQSLGAIAKG